MAQTQVARAVLTVPDISCAHCVQMVSGTLSPLDGITSVAVDLPSKTVQVDYDPARITVDRMSDALADEDYPVASVRTALSTA
jgi:copper chaperone